MILHLIGGLSDGETIDTDNPNGWSATAGELDGPLLPETLSCHSARANRTVYRLTRADGPEGWYQLDPEATAAARSAGI